MMGISYLYGKLYMQIASKKVPESTLLLLLLTFYLKLERFYMTLQENYSLIYTNLLSLLTPFFFNKSYINQT